MGPCEATYIFPNCDITCVSLNVRFIFNRKQTKRSSTQQVVVVGLTAEKTFLISFHFAHTLRLCVFDDKAKFHVQS